MIRTITENRLVVVSSDSVPTSVCLRSEPSTPTSSAAVSRCAETSPMQYRIALCRTTFCRSAGDIGVDRGVAVRREREALGAGLAAARDAGGLLHIASEPGDRQDLSE